MRELIVKLLKYLPDTIFYYLLFIVKLGYIPNLRIPKSLNEKLNYIKLHKLKYELRCMVADRIKVRDYVNKLSPECSLIKNLWVGKDFTKNVWDELPQRFVVKANHGSGMVKVVNKEKDSYIEVAKLCKHWLQKDYASRGREWFYANAERVLIVEEFLEFSGDVPPDYKFFCMNGKVEIVQVDLDRFSGHVRNLYDKEFNRIDGQLYYPQGYDIEKPKMYEQALKIAKELSQEFDFIRVDLYLLENRIYFGELTNIPGNGLEFFKPRSLDFELGKKLNLDSKN